MNIYLYRQTVINNIRINEITVNHIIVAYRQLDQFTIPGARECLDARIVMQRTRKLNE